MAATTQTAEALWRCSKHGFPTEFQPWVDGESFHQWTARMKWSEYATSWVGDAWRSTIAAIRKMEGGLGQSFEPRLRWSSDKREPVPVRDAEAFIQALFVSLYSNPDDSAGANQASADCAAVVSANSQAWEHYHRWFEKLSDSVRGVASAIQKEQATSPESLEAICRKHWHAVDTPNPAVHVAGSTSPGSADAERGPLLPGVQGLHAQSEGGRELRPDHRVRDLPLPSATDGGADPVLTDVGMSILQFLLELNATRSDRRQTSDEIAKKAVGHDSGGSVRKCMGQLKKCDLVSSIGGRGGGYWLTPAGVDRARRLTRE